MRRNVIETVLGAVVLLVAGVFLAFAYNSADLRPVNSACGDPVSDHERPVRGPLVPRPLDPAAHSPKQIRAIAAPIGRKNGSHALSARVTALSPQRHECP